MRGTAEADAVGVPPAIVRALQLASPEATRRWAALLPQSFEVHPLACPMGRGPMRLTTFLPRFSAMRNSRPTTAGSAPNSHGSYAPMAFDLLLTDFNMRGLSGVDVAREARAIRAYRPIILVSRFVDEEARRVPWPSA